MGMRRHHLLVCLAVLLTACHGGGDSSSNTPPPNDPPADTPPVGLDARPSNTMCVAPSKAPGNAGSTIALQRVFAGVALTQPLAMMQAPGDDTRWFVLQKTGAVRVFANTPNVTTASTVLSLAVNSNSEGGLLGMAFHPNWAANHQAFVSFTEGSPMVSVIARFTSNDNGATLTGRQDILKVNQPFDNHDGGNIAFGPDGNLYVGFGDGGSGGDPQGHGQDTKDLLGSFLRINVDGAAPYTIPSDNPFASGGVTCGPDWNVKAGNCKEIYAWGVRNPWRWSFDSSTGELWAGDVGQDAYEEIDKITRGGNYGWNCREGTHAYNNCTANPSGFVEPVDRLRPQRRQLRDRRLRVPRKRAAGTRRRISLRRLWQRPHLAARAERQQLHEAGAARHGIGHLVVRPGQRRRALRRRYQRRRPLQDRRRQQRRLVRLARADAAVGHRLREPAEPEPARAPA